MKPPFAVFATFMSLGLSLLLGARTCAYYDLGGTDLDDHVILAHCVGNMLCWGIIILDGKQINTIQALVYITGFPLFVSIAIELATFIESSGFIPNLPTRSSPYTIWTAAISIFVIMLFVRVFINMFRHLRSKN